MARPGVDTSSMEESFHFLTDFSAKILGCGKPLHLAGLCTSSTGSGGAWVKSAPL